MLTMAPTVDTMSMPSTSFLLDAVADAAAAEHQSNATSSAAATAAAEMAAAESDSAAATTTTTTTYTTPQRLAGLAAVTPSTLPPGDGQFAVAEHDHHEHVGGVGSPEKNARGEGDDVVVSASSTEEVVAARASSAAPAAHAAPAAAHASAAVTHATTSAIAAAKWSSKAVAALAPTPSIQLGPRVTPAVRNNPPQTDMKPRNLDGALKTGESKLNTSQLSASAEVAAAASAAHPAVKLEECPTTPAAQHHNILPPSSFLAAKISPLRSSSARRNGEKKGAASAAAAMPKREHTPPPPVASSNLDPTKLSPGMFLSPRTPKPGYPHTNAMQGTKTSGMTPGLTPGLTPTNFASDFGRGDRMKEAGSMNALDASNVFAWLHSPGGQGLFSPTGGLNSLSVTNTPRGMYGFNGPTGLTGKAGGPPKLAPSLAPSSSGHAHHQGFFAELEAGGDLGVNTPKIPECQRSMISISPLASRKSGRNRAHAFGVEAAPDTPMSINFSEVFASPRLPTPRLSSRRSPMNSAVKKEVGTSSMDGLPSPVASALHTAERDINLDDDLNALLQLAETTTPGGRPMTFMSPLLTNSLRRATNAELDRNGPEPPSSLQLPIISGSSFSELGSPYKKLSRKGSSSSATENISPPQLAIRSTSSGVMDGSPSKSSLKKKSKKRQTPDVAASSAGGEYYGQQQQQQQMGYSQHPSMPHYRHTQAAQAAAAAAHHHGYYHQHPGYHTSSHHAYAYPAHAAHPAPQQHYAYSDQQQAEAAAAAAAMASPAKEELIKPSPVKSSSRKKSSRSRSKPKSATKTPIKSKSPVTIKKVDSRPTTPSSTSSGRRVRKSSAKASSAASASKKNKNAVSDPADKQRITAAIFAVNTVYGDGNEKEKKLAAATLRGVTMRPSGKWQAQLYYAGKSRYIGVFDSKEKASLAYEIAREVLKTDSREEGPTSAEETDRNVCLARKAAHAGINEHATK